MNNFRDFFIGKLIEDRCKELNISMDRISRNFNLDNDEIGKLLKQKTIDTDCLLKWSKFLDYDFFRLYSQHLILYSPVVGKHKDGGFKETGLPSFRKNIYTTELIEFIIERIEKGQMTKQQVINRYGIPKTTLYKWIVKYGNLTKDG
ncbi:transposase [Chryseobacterium sp.]|uniref:transposase n=1 Tax=Chryseobacterium sp. TaxID=1871047 RepID=UPI0028977645|nr:transposase [Chryseobacterium sp.]